eukprot:515537_1
MTSFQPPRAEEATPTQIPRIPPIPMASIHSLQNSIVIPTWPANQSQSLSPNLVQLQSQSVSPTIAASPGTPRDRKRLRESSVDDNKDTKRRKLSGVEAAATTTNTSSYDVPPPSALMYGRPPPISTDPNDTIHQMPLNSAGSNCSSISRTSPSITSSEPNQMSVSNHHNPHQMSSPAASLTSANENHKEIQLVLQNLSSLLTKSNQSDHGVALSSLLSSPQGFTQLGQLLPTQQTQNNVLSMSNSPQQGNNTIAAAHNNNKYKTLGLRIPNIEPIMNHVHTTPAHATHSTDRINQFIFGGTPPNQNRYQEMKNKKSSHSPLPPQLHSQLLVGMNAMNGNISLNDIDNELRKEMNKRQMRKVISHQLEALRQQIYEQEREDEAKLQALKFMKYMQSTQGKQENKLSLNYTPQQHQHHPLPLPQQFLSIPSFDSDNKQKEIISQSKTRSTVIPMLSGHNEDNANNNRSKAALPAMSNSNEWNAVSHSEELKQKNRNRYAGHGRETIIAATGKIQPRTDMDESQCALLCNLMVELCFTEGLERKCDTKDVIKKSKCLKIDPEICLKMNLNTNSHRMNGFSSMIGQPQQNTNSNNPNKNMFRLVPPTFQQTSTSSMPG